MTTTGRRSTLSTLCLLSAAGACVIAAASMQGCYQRVVRAKGLGADRYSVSEPYQESSKLDDWLFGPQESRTNRANNTKLPD